METKLAWRCFSRLSLGGSLGEASCRLVGSVLLRRTEESKRGRVAELSRAEPSRLGLPVLLVARSRWLLVEVSDT